MKLKLSSLGVTAGLIIAAAVTAGSAQAQTLVDLQNVQTNPSAGVPDGTLQSGAAVLGSAGDQWNILSTPYYTANFNQGSTSLSSTAGAATGLTYTLYDLNSTQVGGNGSPGYTTGNSALEATADSGTTNLFSGDAELFSVGGANTYIDEVSGLTNYAGDAFTLIVYAANPSSQAEVVSITQQFGNTGYTNLTTPATQTNSSTSSSISAGVNVAYAKFQGTIGGNGIINWTVQTPSQGTYQTGAQTEGFQLDLVPEPSTWALLGVAMFCGLVVRHRISRNRESNS